MTRLVTRRRGCTLTGYEPPNAVPRSVLDRDDVQLALSQRDFGRFFYLLRKWAGISYLRIADSCGMKPERVGTLARGASRVSSIEKVEQIVDGLRVPGRLVGLAPRSWERGATRTESPPPAIQQASRGGWRGDDGRSHDSIAMDSFRRADRQLGGGHLYSSVLHYLHSTVAPRLFGDADDQPQETYRAATALTEMAGWMAHDSGLNDKAHQHFSSALRLAEVSHAPDIGANVAASMSHLALQRGHPEEATSLARSGLKRLVSGPRPPQLSARLLAMEARALARANEADSARRALESAQRELADAPGEATQQWTSAFDEAALASETASALWDLGQLNSAATEAHRAITLRSTDRARSRVFGQLSLTLIQVQLREPEAACEVGHAALDACQTLGSMRVTQQLNEVAQALGPYGGHPVVAHFLERLAAVARQRAFLFAPLHASHTAGGAAP